MRGIGGDVITGPEDPDGWVYKVGNKAAPAGAGRPERPVRPRLLRSRQRVTWFWCVTQTPGVEGCQRTLELKVTSAAPRHAVSVRVRGYDNSGRAAAIEGATVARGRHRPGDDRRDRAARRSRSAPGTHTLIATQGRASCARYPVEVNVP